MYSRWCKLTDGLMLPKTTNSNTKQAVRCLQAPGGPG